MRAMRTHTPTPDTLPDNVALRLFRLQDAVLHSAYGGWWAQGHDQYILPPYGASRMCTPVHRTRIQPLQGSH